MDLKKKMKNFFTLNRKADGGFTLVELIVVIAILSILSGVTIPAYNGYVEKAKIAADDHTLAVMNTAFTAACMDEGYYDMRNLSFRPAAENIKEAVRVNTEVNDAFQSYFGGGAFQYYDILGFDSNKGIFVANTVAAIKEALKTAWGGSSFADEGEAALEQLSQAFDQIGEYFGVNNFSLDGLLDEAPAAIREAFGFGKFDLSDEEILEKYCPEYAALTTPEEKKAWMDNEENQEKISAIKGNAYVLHIASDATGRTAADVMSDVGNLVTALATPVDDRDVMEYYAEHVLGLTGDKITEYANYHANLEAAKTGLTLPNALSAYEVVAIGKSGVKNTSGISTLGSMYAIAAGYFNSDYYTGDPDAIPNLANFADIFAGKNGIMTEANKNGFISYLGTFDEEGKLTEPGQAQKDIDAYLNYMNYVSANGVTMDSSGAFSDQSGDIWGIINGK